MVPKDNHFTNMVVDKTLVVGKSIATLTVSANVVSAGDIQTNDIVVGRNLTLTEGASITGLPSSTIDPTNFVTLTGDQTISGVKTFATVPVFSQGLLLATEGGVPTPLTFYQRITEIITFSSPALVVPRTTSCHFVRIGDAVTMTVRGFVGVGTGVSGIITGAAIPTQFWPVEEFKIPIVAFEDAESEIVGIFILHTDGTSEMSRGLRVASDVVASRPFVGAALSLLGCQGFTTSWVVSS